MQNNISTKNKNEEYLNKKSPLKHRRYNRLLSFKYSLNLKKKVK